jgi:hypothetical protein
MLTAELTKLEKSQGDAPASGPDLSRPVLYISKHFTEQHLTGH